MWKLINIGCFAEIKSMSQKKIQSIRVMIRYMEICQIFLSNQNEHRRIGLFYGDS